jgi:asparagine synthase (glutamine-hydrolysing)
MFAPDAQVRAEDVAAAVKALHHRGPDGNGIWMSPGKEAALGHTRLAIIDLADGVQPISNEDGQVHIVVNGEFYDFERIRAELQAKGHKFKTGSDSEIALHLYEEHGVDCLLHLRGEFAFVIWDERLKRLFAARDRFGIKPLVYTRQDGRLLMASEAKALFAAGARAAWDAEQFFNAANMQYTLPDRTLFAGVSQLQPGHYLLAQGHQVHTFSYWDLDYASSWQEVAVSSSREADLIEEFRRQMSEAVRLRLRADIPVCCHLSGGLDSSAVLALAMQHSSEPIKCFSVSFNEETYDEKEIAREMAAYAGADFQPIQVSQEDLLQYLPDAVYYSEGLAVNGHLTAKFMLNKEIRRGGYKVALTGEGSDEVLAGYPHLRSDLFRADGREHLLKDLHESNKASQGIMLMQGQSLALDSVRNRLGYVPSFLEAKGTLGFKVCAVLSDEFKSSFAQYDSYQKFLDCFDLEGQVHGRNHVNQSLYLWSKSALANYILKTLGDGMEMANSVEGRLPFLDHHLFEFVRTLPLSLKINGTVEKFVLREALKPLLTNTIYTRQKHPFVAPPVSRFSTPAATEMIQDAVRSKSFASIPFFDQKKVIALFEKFPQLPDAERAAMDPVLMMVFSAAALNERFNLQGA